MVVRINPKIKEAVETAFKEIAIPQVWDYRNHWVRFGYCTEDGALYLTDRKVLIRFRQAHKRKRPICIDRFFREQRAFPNLNPDELEEVFPKSWNLEVKTKQIRTIREMLNSAPVIIPFHASKQGIYLYSLKLENSTKENIEVWFASYDLKRVLKQFHLSQSKEITFRISRFPQPLWIVDDENGIDALIMPIRKPNEIEGGHENGNP